MMMEERGDERGSRSAPTGAKGDIVNLATVPSSPVSSGSTGYRTARDKIKTIGELGEIAEQIRRRRTDDCTLPRRLRSDPFWPPAAYRAGA